jgi:hypothetical protein
MLEHPEAKAILGTIDWRKRLGGFVCSRADLKTLATWHDWPTQHGDPKSTQKRHLVPTSATDVPVWRGFW